MLVSSRRDEKSVDSVLYSIVLQIVCGGSNQYTRKRIMMVMGECPIEHMRRLDVVMSRKRCFTRLERCTRRNNDLNSSSTPNHQNSGKTGCRFFYLFTG